MKAIPTMLIVDDMKINRQILKEMFQDKFDIIEAVDGEEALKIMEQNEEISIVLLDVVMPKMDGFEVLKCMHENEKMANIPVVVQTQYLDKDEEAKALKLGADDFIAKPYNPKVVKRRVHNVVQKKILEHERVDKILRETHREIHYKSRHDSLTALYNREAFCLAAENMFRNNPDKQYIVMRTDIKHFKVLNEVLGSDMGDRVLVTMAQTLETMLEGKGAYGRLDADHFVICCSEDVVTPEKLLTEFEKAIQALSIKYAVDIYIGVYRADNLNIPVDQMCDRASLALGTAKENYLERYALYDAKLRETLLLEQELVSEMNEALKKGEFCFYLQPIYRVSDGAPVSAEALVRWEHPTKQIISPGVFIPLFEKNGFITKLDAYIWESVCKYLRKQQDDNKPVVPISVNASRMNFYEPNICRKIIDIAEKYQISPELLKIEITESAYTNNPHQLLEAVRGLQEYGFKVLMDDFGSGYSSLNMLKDTAVDVLKIDMRFLDDLEKSKRASDIVKSVVQMAKDLKMQTVTEGVETKEQFAFLKEIDCDYVQGFYHSKPLTVENFEILMDNYNTKNKDVKKDGKI